MAFIRSRLVILGVKIERVCRKRMTVFLIVDIVIDGLCRLLSFVGESDERMLTERHGEETVQSFFRRDHQRRGMISDVFPQAEAEEIAQGSFDAGRRLMVPVHAQDERLKLPSLAAGNRS